MPNSQPNYETPDIGEKTTVPISENVLSKIRSDREKHEVKHENPQEKLSTIFKCIHCEEWYISIETFERKPCDFPEDTE